MAPLILALALIAQDPDPAADAPDAPVATAAPRKSTVAALPIQGGPVAPPTDDYGYVGWCYGAVAGYLDLYDVAMPEVIRIERAWPTPSTEENISEVYPAQREAAKANLKLFRQALEAAEKASPAPIQAQGTAAIRRGRGVWTGAGTVPRAQLAQFWMSWTPPARCEEIARALETRSRLFGQALGVNAQPAPLAPPPPPAAPEPPPMLTLAAPSPAEASATPEPADTTPAPVETAAALETAVIETPTAEAGSLAPVANDDPDAAQVDEPAAGEADSAIDALLAAEDPARAADDGAAPLSETPVAAGDSAPDPDGDVVVNAALEGVVDGTAATEPVPEAEPDAAPPPAPAAAAPPPARPKPAKKKGLRETLGGLRGRQQ
ncbi:MAG: hypothetical protein ACOY4K_15785 [Pseudomonadota bacterium]